MDIYIEPCIELVLKMIVKIYRFSGERAGEIGNDRAFKASLQIRLVINGEIKSISGW